MMKESKVSIDRVWVEDWSGEDQYRKFRITYMDEYGNIKVYETPNGLYDEQCFILTDLKELENSK